MKHKKWMAALAAAGTLAAVSGAAHAISPAAAVGLAAIGGAAVGSAAANSAHNNPPAVAVVPAAPTTVVMGAPAATVQEVTPAAREGYTWVPGHWVPNGSVTNYDHDGDGVLNQNDRFPNDPARS